MHEHHVPVVGGVGAVELAVSRAVESTAVVDGVIGRSEGVGGVEVNNSTVSVVRVVKIGNTVVVIVPIDAVFEAVAVDVRVHVVRTVVSVQTSVDLVQIVVVVKVTVPVDVENVDDAVVVVINVIPVADTVTVPVVELGERGSASLTLRVGVGWVGVGLCWTVPCGDNRGCIEWERVVFVLDVVVVKVVRQVSAAHGEISEIVGRGRTTQIRVKPIVNAVVVLVKRSADIVVEVVIVIDFAVNIAVLVAVCARNLKVDAGYTRDGDFSCGVTTRDGDGVTNGIS